MGDDLTPRNVLSITSGFGIMYNILPNTEENFVVNGEHILCLFEGNNYTQIIEITVNDFLLS